MSFIDWWGMFNRIPHVYLQFQTERLFRTRGICLWIPASRSRISNTSHASCGVVAARSSSPTAPARSGKTRLGTTTASPLRNEPFHLICQALVRHAKQRPPQNPILLELDNNDAANWSCERRADISFVDSGSAGIASSQMSRRQDSCWDLPFDQNRSCARTLRRDRHWMCRSRDSVLQNVFCHRVPCICRYRGGSFVDSQNWYSPAQGSNSAGKAISHSQSAGGAAKTIPRKVAAVRPRARLLTREMQERHARSPLRSGSTCDIATSKDRTTRVKTTLARTVMFVSLSNLRPQRFVACCDMSSVASLG